MPSKSLGTLTLDLIAKIGGFEAGMDKAGRKSKQTADSIEASMKTIGTVLGGVAVAAAGTAAAMIKSSIDTADAANKQAQKIGITVESLTALQHAADLADIGNEDLTASMVKLDKAIREAAEGSKTQAEAFKAMDVAAKNSDGSLRGADEVLLDIAAHFAKMPDGAEKSALALDVFGKSGAQLIPLLNSGADGIREMTEEAKRMGLVISTETAAGAEEFNDNITRLQKNVDGLGRAMAAELLPELGRISAAMVQAANDSGLLYAAFIGLGGIASEALNLNPDALEQVNAEIKKLTQQLEAQKGIQADGGFWNLVSGDLPQQIADTQMRLNGLIAQRNELLNPPKQTAKTGFVFELPDLSQLEGQAKTAVENAGKVIEASEKFREAAARAEEARKQSILDSIAGLEKEEKTWGMTADEIKLYDLAVEGATDAQLKHAASVLKTIDGLEAQKKATDDYKALLSDLRTDEEKLTDQMRERLDVLDKMSDVQGDERTKVASRIIGDATTEAPKFEGLAPEVGGAAGELDKINSAQKELEDWYAKQLEMVKAFRDEKAENSAAADEEEIELAQQHADKLAAIESARGQAQLAVAGQIFGNMAALSQSGNKELVRIGKAAAIAQATISGVQAVMNALAIQPYPVGLALSISAGVLAAANIAQIAGVEFKEGGYTGDMGVNDVAGVVHGQEFVMDAAATARIGRANLEAMRKGKVDRAVSNIRSGEYSGRTIATRGQTINQTIQVSGRPDNRTATQIARASERKQRQAQAKFG